MTQVRGRHNTFSILAAPHDDKQPTIPWHNIISTVWSQLYVFIYFFSSKNENHAFSSREFPFKFHMASFQRTGIDLVLHPE